MTEITSSLSQEVMSCHWHEALLEKGTTSWNTMPSNTSPVKIGSVQCKHLDYYTSDHCLSAPLLSLPTIWYIFLQHNLNGLLKKTPKTVQAPEKAPFPNVRMS